MDMPQFTPNQIRPLRKKRKQSRTDFGIDLGFAEKSARISVWKLETGRIKPAGPTLVLPNQLADQSRKQ